MSTTASACPSYGRRGRPGPALRIICGLFVVVAVWFLILAGQADQAGSSYSSGDRAGQAIFCFAVAAVFLGVDNYRRR